MTSSLLVPAGSWPFLEAKVQLDFIHAKKHSRAQRAKKTQDMSADFKLPKTSPWFNDLGCQMLLCALRKKQQHVFTRNAAASLWLRAIVCSGQ